MKLLLSIHLLVAILSGVSQGFVPRAPWTAAPSKTSSSTTELYVFDFFKKRSEEGVEQMKKLSDAASKGKLGEGLSDVAKYTTVTNKAFADGLAKSRNRLLANLEMVLTGSEDPLEDLQDILLQADLGMATAEDIVKEVKSLREDSTTFLSKTDLMSVMRGKLIEALETDSGAIRFAEPGSKIPTVLFILGANGMGK
jgi:signal recognition particle GTPase